MQQLLPMPFLSLRRYCHEEIADLAELCLLNRLSAEDTAKVESHLLSCSRCMGIFEETEQFLMPFRGANERMDAETVPVTESSPHVRRSKP